MKNKIFDFRLYLQGLGRLRVIGIALAILCITISVLIPTVRWLDGPKNTYQVENQLDGEELVVVGTAQTSSDWEALIDHGKLDYVKVKETITDGKTIVPVTVASYLSPFLVLMMFAFLNKRKESDFFHAIPFTRGCVYTSFVAAILTWVWGVLIISSLSAALIWALCPYVTFSFGGLICRMLLACLNAALLAAFTTVAVSLTGTGTSAVVTALLVTWSWRLVLWLGKLCLDEVLYMTPVDSLLDGYLNFSYLLPVAIITGNQTTPVVIYTIVATFALFALGGLLYVKRRSELAGRSVPGRLVHNLLHCLMTLPVALLLTYQLFNSADFATVLVIFICMLLVFYLYELLTTKSARRMFRSTPWLMAVIGVCIVFTGIVHVSGYVERNERTDADRIKSVEIVGLSPVISDTVVINSYELSQLGEIKDAETIEFVSEAWGKRQKNLYNYYDQYNRQLTVRIKLKGGRTVTRDIKVSHEEFYSVMADLQKKAYTKPIPSDEEVTEFYIYTLGDYGRSISVRVSGEWRARLLQALRDDYANLTLAQKKELYSYSTEPLTRLQLSTETMTYTYGVRESMPKTMALLCEIYAMPRYKRAEAARSAINGWTLESSSVTVRIFSEDGKCLIKKDVCTEANCMTTMRRVLLRAIEQGEAESGEGQRVIIHISGMNRDGYDHDYYNVYVVGRLSESEWNTIYRQ